MCLLYAFTRQYSSNKGPGKSISGPYRIHHIYFRRFDNRCLIVRKHLAICRTCRQYHIAELIFGQQPSANLVVRTVPSQHRANLPHLILIHFQDISHLKGMQNQLLRIVRRTQVYVKITNSRLRSSRQQRINSLRRYRRTLCQRTETNSIGSFDYPMPRLRG